MTVVEVQVHEPGLIEKVVLPHFGTGVLGSAEEAGLGFDTHLTFLQDPWESKVDEEQALWLATPDHVVRLDVPLDDLEGVQGSEFLNQGLPELLFGIGRLEIISIFGFKAQLHWVLDSVVELDNIIAI